MLEEDSLDDRLFDSVIYRCLPLAASLASRYGVNLEDDGVLFKLEYDFDNEIKATNRAYRALRYRTDDYSEILNFINIGSVGAFEFFGLGAVVFQKDSESPDLFVISSFLTRDDKNFNPALVGFYVVSEASK